MDTSTGASRRGASYDSTTPAVLIHDLLITHSAVCSEAVRWSTGQRGPAVAAPQMADVDLSAFVTQALAVGAQAIASAGGVQDTFNLEQLVTDVGARTAESTAKAAQATTEVVSNAAIAVQKASIDAQKVIVEAGESARKNFTETVDTARVSLREEVNRLFGGESPELTTRLMPLLEKFGRDVDERAAKQTGELFDRAAKQLDPDDPTSPLAKHQRELTRQQKTLAEAVEKNHQALTAKVEQLATAVQVTSAASAAATATAKVTPLKGATYADGVHAVMRDIAAGLGDEYTDTGSVTGCIARSKKGDGVLTVDAGRARVVLEMTDSVRQSWGAYLDEAERNRAATASLGLVRDASQNGGQSIRVLASRRIVLVFNPASDDPGVLRTVVQLLRVSAIAACARQDLEEIETANERIREALEVITKIDDIRKAAGSIRVNANKIDDQGTAMQTTLSRLLTQALTALAGSTSTTSGDSSASDAA